MQSIFSLAAEPASILYIATGAVLFAFAGLRKSAKSSRIPGQSPEQSSIQQAKPSPVLMLICDRASRTRLRALNLL
jgi:hypothetical protein